MHMLKRRACHAMSRTWLGFVAGVTLVLGLAVWSAPVTASSVHVTPLEPNDHATVNGTIHLSARVDGLRSDQYEGFWAVDNGQWNRMTTQNDNGMSASVDVSAWNWRLDGSYSLSFIALNKDGWKPEITTIQVAVPPKSSTSLNGPMATTTVMNVLQSGVRLVSPDDSPALPNKLYSDPNSDVAARAAAYASSHPSYGALLRRLASQPMAAWFGNWNSDIYGDVNGYVSRAATANALPVLVLYNIPSRDCGSYSAGGAGSASAYRDWMQTVARAIGHRPAMVIVEPDALANMDCLSSDGQKQRSQLIAQAVSTLKDQTDARVYLDAGHPGWQTPDKMASRLKNAGIAQADGFALNMSNYYRTTDDTNYGATLSKLVSDKHFVVDTSRNGSGPAADNAWCNPAGRTVGQAPTLSTGNVLVDAYIWGNGPGGSDGTCGPSINGSTPPIAGTWWPERALELLRNW